MKLEKGDNKEIAQQIDDLNNIIAYENAHIMNYYSSPNKNKYDGHEEIFQFKDEDNEELKSANKFWSQEELRMSAIEVNFFFFYFY